MRRIYRGRLPWMRCIFVGSISLLAVACSKSDSDGSDSTGTNNETDDVETVDTISDSATEIYFSTDPGADNDSDGWSQVLDCDDSNPNIHRFAIEVMNGVDDDCDSAIDELEGGDSSSDPDVCQANDLEIEPAPVALMILQDMSASMDPNANTIIPQGRWAVVKPAIEDLLAEFADSKINFGLDFFPAINAVEDGFNPKCTVNTEPVFDCSAQKAQAIIDALPDDDAPAGYTPLLKAMDNYTIAGYAPKCQFSTEQAFLLIVSDGTDSCGMGDDINVNDTTAEDLGNMTAELLSAGIKTFAIGFGDAADSDQLNAIAAAGGTQFTTFLSAENSGELKAAFAQIAASIVKCKFDLPTVEENAERDKVNFYFNEDNVDSVIPFDDECKKDAGWAWVDSTKDAVYLCPSRCEQLQQGGITIFATWGCPTAVIN